MFLDIFQELQLSSLKAKAKYIGLGNIGSVICFDFYSLFHSHTDFLQHTPK